MNAPLLERHRDRIAGVPARYDRIVITGTLSGACHAAGMTGYPNAPLFASLAPRSPRFAGPLRDRIGANADAAH